MSAGAVVVGAGQAGFQAAAALRQWGYEDPVVLLGDEPGAPYQRPPLSKEVLAGASEPDSAALRPAGFYVKQRIDVRTRCRVEAIDRDARAVVLASGERLPYAHLVLATGARNRALAVPGAELEGVLDLRTVPDAVALRERLVAGARVVVVGAGFIGLEVAAAARTRGARVTVLEVAPRCMGRALSEPMAAFLAERHRAAGTDLQMDAGVEAMVPGAGGRVAAVVVAGGGEIPADVVVVGIGIRPNGELAEAAGLAVEDGILVDPTLRTEDPAIWAAGDCVRLMRPGGASLRLESVQNATDQGRAVAAAITGTPAPYDALPWFWSDQLGCRLQIAGLQGGHDQVVLRGRPADGAFSAFCFAGGRLLAVESVNQPRDHMAARKLLASGGTLAPGDAADPSLDLRALTGMPV
jgi:3-phenylpropionate/trans-cinnamate dioxygenase ferredoxin reductase subunit